MTGTELKNLINYKCKTNSTTFTASDMLVLVNLKKDTMASKIQQFRNDVWNIPALDDLVADQREYAFPTDVMNNLVDLELKFSASGNYVKATAVQRTDLDDALQESRIVNAYTNTEPRYFVRRKALFILSEAISAVTDGIKLVYDSFPASLANLTGSADLSADPSTTTHGFPREFHELWATSVSIEYKGRNNIKLSVVERNFERDFQSALEDFGKRVLDEALIGHLPPGEEEGDDGFNY